MNCPFCRHAESRVVDSRDAGGSVRRRRECEACGRRFTTHERVEHHLPVVVKKGGYRQQFDRAKLRAGLDLACRKRPVPAEDLELACDSVIEGVLAEADREISSRRLGELVMEQLRGIDGVAFLRFASVYLEFENAEAFLDLVREAR